MNSSKIGKENNSYLDPTLKEEIIDFREEAKRGIRSTGLLRETAANVKI